MLKTIKRRFGGSQPEPMEAMTIPSSEAAKLGQQASTDLERQFYDRFGKGGRLVHKWVHFLPIYETWFSKYRGTDFTMLEIGVSKGGSLELWRDYFGEAASITGIDIEPECANRVSPPNRVFVGSQDDAAFLRKVVDETGQPDVILDDGSHVGRHQITSFNVLFPLLREGGLYMIEDLHTSYWPGEHEGSYGKAETGIGLVKQIIDDMHAWYHSERDRTSAATWIPAVHVYDSIVVIEKAPRSKPGHIQVQ